MSQTRNSHTPNQRVAYWKKRMVDRTRTAIGWCAGDLEKVCENARHVGLDDKDILLAVQKINTGFTDLIKGIVEAQEKKVEKPKKKIQ